MNFFSDALDRLKHELRVSKDGEVAEALGMTKTAFSERKRRGAFPEKELKALADQRPNLKVDVLYVLTGERERADAETQDEFIDRMQAIKVAGAIVDALPLPEPEREGLKLCLTGDPKRDAQAIAQGAGYSTAHESTVLTTGDGATVYRLESPAATPAAQPAAEWLQVLELTLDELNSAGRRLPGAKVIQLVDLLMQLQQAGARLEPELLRSQLRLIA